MKASVNAAYAGVNHSISLGWSVLRRVLRGLGVRDAREKDRHFCTPNLFFALMSLMERMRGEARDMASLLFEL